MKFNTDQFETKILEVYNIRVDQLLLSHPNFDKKNGVVCHANDLDELETFEEVLEPLTLYKIDRFNELFYELYCLECRQTIFSFSGFPLHPINNPHTPTITST